MSRTEIRELYVELTNNEKLTRGHELAVDTGEVIESRPLTVSERQSGLDFDTGNN